MTKKFLTPKHRKLDETTHIVYDEALKRNLSYEYWEILPALNAVAEYIMGKGVMATKQVCVSSLLKYARGLTGYVRGLDGNAQIYSDLTSYRRMTAEEFFEYVELDDTELEITSEDIRLMRTYIMFEDIDSDEFLGPEDLKSLRSSAFEPDDVDVLSVDRCPNFTELATEYVDELLGTAVSVESLRPATRGLYEVYKDDDTVRVSDLDKIHILARHVVPVMVATEFEDATYLSLYEILRIATKAEEVIAHHTNGAAKFWHQIDVLREVLWDTLAK